jgi:hypothetical protein
MATDFYFWAKLEVLPRIKFIKLLLNYTFLLVAYFLAFSFKGLKYDEVIKLF